MDTLGDDGIDLDLQSDPWLKQISGQPFTTLDSVDGEEPPEQELAPAQVGHRLIQRWWKWSYAWFGVLFIMGLSCGYLLQPLSSAKAVGESGAPQQVSGQSETAAKSDTIKSTATVDVQGDVRKPGVYQLAPNARVEDAVRKAGGFLHAGDASLINLAAPVDDGAEVVVPTAGPSAAVSGTANAGPAAPTHKAQMDLNTADEASLETIPGIGPAKATAIVQYRKAHGPFHQVKDLLHVSGIGQGTLSKLAPYLMVTGG